MDLDLVGREFERTESLRFVARNSIFAPSPIIMSKNGFTTVDRHNKAVAVAADTMRFSTRTISPSRIFFSAMPSSGMRKANSFRALRSPSRKSGTLNEPFSKPIPLPFAVCRRKPFDRHSLVHRPVSHRPISKRKLFPDRCRAAGLVLRVL